MEPGGDTLVGDADGAGAGAAAWAVSGPFMGGAIGAGIGAYIGYKYCSGDDACDKPALRLVLACCPSCGGHSEMSVMPAECSCGLLAAWQ